MRTLGVAERSADAAGWAADDALTALYAAHWAPLVRLAWLLVHDQGRAQDIVQDVFVASHARMAQLREEGNALAYLRRGVVNRCTSVHRHRTVEDRWFRAETGGGDAPGRRTADSAEDEVLRHGAGDDLLAVLHTLPTRQREVLVLRYYADLSEQQIAEALEISTGAVKSHAHRGLAALRDAMGGAR